MRLLGGLALLFLIITIISALFQAISVQVAPGLGIVVLTAFVVAIGSASILVSIWMRAARSPERAAPAWIRALTGPNGKILFGILIVVWAIAMGSLNLILPPGLNGAPSEQLGGLSLVGLILGAMIFLGFIWSVIGE